MIKTNRKLIQNLSLGGNIKLAHCAQQQTLVQSLEDVDYLHQQAILGLMSRHTLKCFLLWNVSITFAMEII
jgi:hypothetical protein